MVTCPFCGESNPPSSHQCLDCGAALDSDHSNSNAADSANRGESERTEGSDAIESEIIELLREGKKIPAIKLYREQSGSGLKDAKEHVEAVARRQGIEASGGGCAGALMLVSLTVAVVVIVAVKFG